LPFKYTTCGATSRGNGLSTAEAPGFGLHAAGRMSAAAKPPDDLLTTHRPDFDSDEESDCVPDDSPQSSRGGALHVESS
jgi:hypothetical protein